MVFSSGLYIRFALQAPNSAATIRILRKYAFTAKKSQFLCGYARLTKTRTKFVYSFQRRNFDFGNRADVHCYIVISSLRMNYVKQWHDANLLELNLEIRDSS